MLRLRHAPRFPRHRHDPERDGSAAGERQRGLLVQLFGRADPRSLRGFRSGVHRRARQLLYGHRFGERLALCPAPRRAARFYPDARRQDFSVGNLATGGRAALIMVDYPNRRRLKIYAHVEVKNLADNPELAAAVANPGYKAKPERVLLFHLDAFDWNCPQHITQRFTEAEIDTALAPVRDRLAQLKAENKALREKLGTHDTAPL